ncbi:hypothetical protein ACQ33O_06520 [Ferruginibacter sp. SUN002]|uniref:hypothetical protein n=1 Tax=Ferruginibacter sp. SUN002 TaxID=2937789 RepID=UPI003D3648BE
MQYIFFILWILTIGLSFCFIYFCYCVAKVIKAKWGLFYALVFVFGLVLFTTRINNTSAKAEPNKWNFISQDSIAFGTMSVLFVDLEKSKYKLGIQYGKEKTNKTNVPVQAFSVTEGSSYFNHWVPFAVMVNPTDSINQFKYSVYGQLEWEAFGLTLYSEPKNYSGIFTLK